jgi:hypothetical protein
MATRETRDRIYVRLLERAREVLRVEVDGEVGDQFARVVVEVHLAVAKFGVAGGVRLRAERE